eukprot:261712_1
MPKYITQWSDSAISDVVLTVNSINSDILQQNGCVYVNISPHSHEHAVAPIHLQHFGIIQLPKNEQSTIDSIDEKTNFKNSLMNWLLSIENVRCYKYEGVEHTELNGKREMMSSVQANEFMETRIYNQKHVLPTTNIYHSHALDQINELRNGEGETSWQTDISNNVKPLHVDSVKFNSRLITYVLKFG